MRNDSGLNFLMIRTPFGAMTVRWDVCLTEYSQLVRRQTGREDCRTMALSSAAVVLLTTIFVVDERASARMFTAECTKNPDGQFLCATNDPDTRVDPPQGMTGYVGCAMRCTLDELCQHFNHFPSPSMPSCHLFYSRPINVSVMNGCEHYHAAPAGASRNSHRFDALIRK